jgi:hypothetical protein
MVKYPRQEQPFAGEYELEKRAAYSRSTPDEQEVAAELGRPTELVSPIGLQHCYSYGDRERLGAKRSTFAHNHRG